MARQGKSTHLYFDDVTRAALDALASRNGRTITQEVEHAVRRHLASPPALTTPQLADAPAPAPRRRPGRPRKAAAPPA